MTKDEFNAELQKRAQAIANQVRHALETVPQPEGVSDATHALFTVLGTLATRVAALEINNERISKLLTELLSEDTPASAPRDDEEPPTGGLH